MSRFRHCGRSIDRPYSWTISCLEFESQGELNLAFAVCGLGNRSGRAGVLAWVRGIEHNNSTSGSRRVLEVRVVEDIESLCPELQTHFFAYRNPLEEGHVQVPESRSREPAARDVAEGTCCRQQESIGIEISAGRLEAIHAQNRVSFEVGIDEGYIRKAAIAVSSLIETYDRGHREAALRIENAVPLPAADQLVDQSCSTRANRFAIAERQRVAGVGIELVRQTVGSHSTAELGIIWVTKRRQFVIGRGTKDRGIEIDDLSPCVVDLVTQAAPGPLRQRRIQRVIVGGSEVIPAIGRTEIRIWTSSNRHV